MESGDCCSSRLTYHNSISPPTREMGTQSSISLKANQKNLGPIDGPSVQEEQIVRKLINSALPLIIERMWHGTQSPQFSILSFGAKANGVSDDSKALLAAWKSACKVNGGIVIIPSEFKFLIKPVTLQGPCLPNLVLQNFTIQGKGTADGQGSNWWGSSQINQKKRAKKIPDTKPTALRFYSSYNITVRDIRIINSPLCHLKFDNSKGVKVENVTISAPENSPNTDGIHLQNSQDVEIMHSDIGTGGLGKDKSIACVSNILVENIIMQDTLYGARIKTWQGGSGSVKNVTFSNIQVSNVKVPITIDQYYCDKNECKNQTGAVAISGVTFDQIIGSYSVQPIHLACSNSIPCTDVDLVSIELKPSSQNGGFQQALCWNTYGKTLGPLAPVSMDYCVRSGGDFVKRIARSHDVWKDPWIPTSRNFRINTNHGEWPLDMRVRDLFREDQLGWDTELVSNIFNQDEAKDILGIPIRNTTSEDRICWHHTTFGQYSVKSGYKLAVNLEQNMRQHPSSSEDHTTLWKWLWKLNIPPKVHIFIWKVIHGTLPVQAALYRRNSVPDPMCKRCGDAIETVEHALRDCPWSAFFWRVSPLRLPPSLSLSTASMADMAAAISRVNDSDAQCLFAMSLWVIWYARNLLVFQEKMLSHQDCLNLATKCLCEYQAAQKHPTLLNPGGVSPSWQRPPEGTIKINTDASVIKMVGTGLGAILRDHNGNVIHTIAKKITHEFSIEIAEAMACLEGLTTAKNLQLTSVLIESDCMHMVQAFHRKETNLTYLGSVIEDIRQLSRDFPSFSLRYIPRTANRVAHYLAKFAFTNSCRGFYCGTIPDELMYLVPEEDLPP
ncbi:hypothetical protein DH2020_049737 [Rehmannia glutinosa]|uniref:Polygalacturonase n=1 Tax=Rehmannia glutinosa TaxID=99300 RepID=A0ABR0U2Q6_REHGL